MESRMSGHVGISVSNMTAAREFFGQFGYRGVFSRYRDEPFLGQAVGHKGAAATIVYMKRANSVTIELLEYSIPKQVAPNSTLPAVFAGVMHVAIEVTAMPEGLKYIGRSVIPDGPNEGDEIAYVKGPDGITVELIVKA